MYATIIVLLTIIIICAIFATIYIMLYNKIQYSKIRVDEAERLIIEELNNRFELIMKCKEPIEKNTKMDLNIFTELEKTKESNISSYDLEKK